MLSFSAAEYISGKAPPVDLQACIAPIQFKFLTMVYKHMQLLLSWYVKIHGPEIREIFAKTFINVSWAQRYNKHLIRPAVTVIKTLNTDCYVLEKFLSSLFIKNLANWNSYKEVKSHMVGTRLRQPSLGVISGPNLTNGLTSQKWVLKASSIKPIAATALLLGIQRDIILTFPTCFLDISELN